jgi:predicted transcriptional regulator
MKQDVAAVRTYFAKLGLAQEIADIYLALYSSGPQTISELSRTSGVERTRVYRLLDTLMERNLIEVESRYKRGVIKAAPVANLNILISKREEELKNLQDELSLIEQVLTRNSLSSPATRVQFYSGPEGAKQMFWNQTKARSETHSILLENMQINTDAAFFKRWVHACNQADLQMYSVFGDAFIESQRKWYATRSNERLKHWEGRHVTADTFTIKHSTIIYDDVVGYFNWKDSEVFSIEIYNRDIAQSQRQLFELLWQQAEPMSI